MATLLETFVQGSDKAKTILTTFSGSYNITDLERHTELYIKLLIKKNIQGKRIALLVPNVFSFVSLAIAINQLGGIIVPLSWQYQSDDLKQLLHLIDPHIVFSISNYSSFTYSDAIVEWAKSNGKQTTLFRSGDGYSWEEHSFGVKEKSPEQSSAVLLCCTSGSTGVPKAIKLGMNSISFNVEYMKDIFDVKAMDRILLFAPPTTAFGFEALFMGVRERIRSVYPESFDIPLVIKLMKESEVNKIVATPSTMKAIYGFARRMAPEIIDNLQFCGLTGEFMTEEIAQQVVLGEHCTLTGMYGMSETGGVLYCDLRTKVEWSIYRGLDYRLDPPDEEISELMIRTPGIFMGYYQQPEITAQAWTPDGWFKTGDLVRINENQKLEIVGRKKELIKKGGQQVVPGEIEQILLQHPNVIQAAVFGAPHPVYGEQVVAFIVPKATVSEKELYQFCAEKIARYKVPDDIEIVSEIPTVQGKVDKIFLRNSFLLKKG